MDLKLDCTLDESVIISNVSMSAPKVVLMDVFVPSSSVTTLVGAFRRPEASPDFDLKTEHNKHILPSMHQTLQSFCAGSYRSKQHESK